MQDYVPLLLFFGFFIGMGLIGWVWEQIEQYNAAQKQQERDDAAQAVLADNGISDDVYHSVKQQLNHISETYVRQDGTSEIVEPVYGPNIKSQAMLCPKCKEGYMQKRNGQYGMFLGCSRYPSCNLTKNIGWVNKTAKDAAKATYEERFMKDLERAYN